MENKKESIHEEPLTKEQAKGEIMAIMNEISLMGANDYELPTIHRILKDLETDKIDPAVALEEVMRIKNSKQDYH